MKISRLKLENYACFEALDIKLTSKWATKDDGETGSNITVIVGNNGAGKTNILNAIATGLSWFVAKVQNEETTGQSIAQNRIKNGSAYSTLAFVKRDSNDLGFEMTTVRKGAETDELANNVDDFIIQNFAWGLRYTKPLSKKMNFPIAAYYGVGRKTVDDIIFNALEPKTHNLTSPLDGYKNALNPEYDFSDFFEWFRYREDIENQTAPHASVMRLLEKHADKQSDVYQNMQQEQKNLQDKSLACVRDAISFFLSEGEPSSFNKLYIERTPALSMMINKDGHYLSIDQLSYGERSVLTMVGDIARRLTLLNPSLENPLEGDGIILIDEPETHLHPRWQQRILTNLEKTFPNVQFVVTTHSHLLLTTVKKEQIIVLSDNNAVTPIGNTFGEPSNYVLTQVLGVDTRPPLAHNDTLQAYLTLIDANLGNSTEAEALRIELNKMMGDNHSDLKAADRAIQRKELLG
ncbi:MAG: putative ATP-binding protein involved in virulence [Phenylobacterium sp.]|jgi:predicted ATP-binding protein involved in virulence